MGVNCILIWHLESNFLVGTCKRNWTLRTTHLNHSYYHLQDSCSDLDICGIYCQRRLLRINHRWGKVMVLPPYPPLKWKAGAAKITRGKATICNDLQNLPRMCHGETPLFGDVATEKHPAQEPGGISRRNHWRELGRNRFPCCLGLLILQQVFPQGFHKILVQPGVWTMRIIHFGYG